MGISKLLQVLSPMQDEIFSNSEYAGKTAGVDIMCWLLLFIWFIIGCTKVLYHVEENFACHFLQRSTFSVDNPIFRYVDYCMKFIDMLLKNSITPVIVFDGADLPLKENTNNARRE